MVKFVKRVLKSKVLLGLSFVAWIASVGLFLFESGRFYNPESKMYENWQQIVFLITIIFGSGSFLAFALLLFTQIYRKIRAWAFVLLILLAMIPAGVVVYALGQKNAAVQEVYNVVPGAGIPQFTGQEVFDAVNAYRKEKGVNELKLDPNLCGNLAQRYFDIKKGLDEGVAHKGFEEWAKKYVDPWGGYYIGEDFAWATTPEGIIKEWEGSPGHRLSVLDPKNKVGCSYAAEGYAVLILGYRISDATQKVSLNTTPSRTGAIVQYHEWCANKDISVYENELITKKSSDGNLYTMTEGDWVCYEKYLETKR